MTDSPAAPARPLIYLMAGEPSGDLLGGRLMQALKEKTGGAVSFAGVGGETMTVEGLESLFPMEEISLMGLIELLPHARNLFARMRQTVAEIRRLKPDAIVTIDSPGFCLGVLNRLGDTDIPRIHYVAPSVWAWREGRLKKFVGRTDHMLCLLPFEPPWFERAGLPATFVGHPVLERGIEKADGAGFRSSHGIDPGDLLLGVFPGSRKGELNHHMPIFRQTVALLSERYPGLKVVIPSVAATAERIRSEAADWAAPVIVVTGEQERYAAMAACNYALAASGTVAIELAQSKVPSVVAYHTNPLTEFIARRMVKVRFANLCNILVDEEVVPERIQRDCRADILAADLEKLIEDKESARAQIDRVTKIMAQLMPSDGMPSETAARVVLDQVKSSQ